MVKRVLLVVSGLLVVLVIVLLLIEIVPNPPLMAPELRLTEGMVGKWKGTARVSTFETGPDDLFVEIDIRPNREVTGWVGGARIKTATISNNRSWLGRRLSLRTDYIILGEAVVPSSGRRWEFQAPMRFHEGVYRGALFIEGKPRRFSLFRVQQTSSNKRPAGIP
jgi:hypothetical protein